VAASRFRVFVLCAIAVHVLAAWFNGGYLDYDEHYQIIEFAQYKLGRQSAAGLAWEYAAQIRPGLQPWLAAGAIRVGHAVGIQSPFLIAFALRLVSTLLSLWVSLELCARALRTVRTPSLRLCGLLASCFFWMTPTLHSRFASGTWGAALFVGGLCLLLDALDSDSEGRITTVALTSAAGFLWSAAFYSRFQIGAAIAGAGLWLLLIRGARANLLLNLAGSFLIGAGLNTVIDHWLYSVWTLTPYNYFLTNVIAGRAATFGTSPWWMLGLYLVVGFIPPYSLGILALLGAGCWYARRHVLVWVTIPFVLLHAVAAHKEPRFLIPLVFVIGPLFALSVDALPDRFQDVLFSWLRTRAGRASLAGFSGINLVLLCVTMLMPANDAYRLNRWLWTESRRSPITLYTVGASPMGTVEPPTDTFYLDDRITVSRLENADKRGVLGNGPTYVYFPGLDLPPTLTSLGGCTPVLQTFPPWLARFAEVAASMRVGIGTLCRMETAGHVRAGTTE
jgi:GPI mannosyltransferase 3